MWLSLRASFQCSFAGVYQPTLPDVNTPYGKFVLIGGYVDLFKGLGFNTSLNHVLNLRHLQVWASWISQSSGLGRL